VEIVRPCVVVTLGKRAYRAISSLYGLRCLPFKAAVEREGGFPLSGDTTLYPVYHCGMRILNTHRSVQQQMSDWIRIGRALRNLVAAMATCPSEFHSAADDALTIDASEPGKDSEQL
jgi:hypothetical protein